MAIHVDESCDSLRTLLKHEEVPGIKSPCEPSEEGISSSFAPLASSANKGSPAVSKKSLCSNSKRDSTNISVHGSREGTPLRTPNRTPKSRRKDLLVIGGIEIEKRRSSSSASYRIENNKVSPPL